MLVRCSLPAIYALVVGIPLFADAQAVASEPLAQVEVRGIIADVSRVPIPGAEVAAVVGSSTVRQTLTADNGSFSLSNLPAGPVSLRIRRLGYEPRTVEILIGTEALAPLDIILKTRPAELANVLIEGTERRGGLREFYEHKDQRQTFAKFLDQDDIRKRSPMYSSDLFRSVPGISIKAASYNGNTIRIRGCQPMVWVDGQRVPGAELDEVIPPDDIAGIEFYTSMAGVPAQYMERANRACGTVLVWTKKQ
jgi:hypothetical protein